MKKVDADFWETTNGKVCIEMCPAPKRVFIETSVLEEKKHFTELRDDLLEVVKWLDENSSLLD